MADIAKVFRSGGSQAVRLPLESRRAEWSQQFLSLAGTAAEFPYPDEPAALKPAPDLDD